MSQSARRQFEYAHLSPPIESWPLVYGPVHIPPYGEAIGINLLGEQKICSFNCVYCELGETRIRLNQAKNENLFPAPSTVEHALRQYLRPLAKQNQKVTPIIISGYGEPTLHPRLGECVEAIARTRDELSQGAPVMIMSNGAHLDQRKVREALNLFDRRIIKLDAGHDKIFKAMNEPLTRAPLERIIQGMSGLKDVVIRGMFINGAVSNTDDSHVEEWLELLGLIKPIQVQIDTLTRVPWKSGLTPVDDIALYGIAAKVKRKLQIETTVLI